MRNSLAYVALGANLPFGERPPAANLRAALGELGRRGLRIEAVSRFFHTPCFPPGAGPDYINAVAALSGGGRGAGDILALLHEVEALFGRERIQRWGQRTLDLDLIALDDLVLPDLQTWRHWRELDPERQRREAPGELVIPHPRLEERAFVLVPLADIAPRWRHPVTGRTVQEMLAALAEEDRAGVRALQTA
jgi:2-amino-4-hydroxy-6-hydroxymethyldihydropteridine diphosphokinase